MPKKNFIIFALFFSFALHALVVSLCSLRIGARASPLICSWQNIVSRSDLFLEQKEVVFPEDLSLSSNSLRKKYFFLPFYKPRFLKRSKPRDLEVPFFTAKSHLRFLDFSAKPADCLYLWERVFIFPCPEEEKASYRVCVSSQGKILFLYPEILPFNSSGSLHLQEYIREAALFVGNKFSWTRLEGVVK